jgi:hypothetical protein
MYLSKAPVKSRKNEKREKEKQQKQDKAKEQVDKDQNGCKKRAITKVGFSPEIL